MKVLGVPPGPIVGEAKAFLMEIRLDEGEIPAEEARERLARVGASPDGVVSSPSLRARQMIGGGRGRAGVGRPQRSRARAARRRGSRRGAARRRRRRSCGATSGWLRPSRVTIIGDGSKYERRTSSRPSGSTSGPLRRARLRAASGARARTRTPTPDAARGAPGATRGRSPRSRARRPPRARGRSSRRGGTRDRRRRSRATRPAPPPSSASRFPSASCADETSSAITCAPWPAIVTAFSPAPQPRSSTRRPATSPQSRRSASVGRSGPNWTTPAPPASPRRAATRSHDSMLVMPGVLPLGVPRRRVGRATRSATPALRPRTPRPCGAPRRRGTAPPATS